MKFHSYHLQTKTKENTVRLEDRLHKYLYAENILKRDEESPKNGLYDLLSLNEFDVIEKQVKRIRRFSFDKLPKWNIEFLVGGAELPLIAIHDFLMREQDYLVISARDVTSADYSGTTEEASNLAIRGYVKDMLDYLKLIEGVTGEVENFAIAGVEDECDREAGVCIRGPIERILAIRKMLRTGFHGLKVEKDSISYS
jgi:hypothetical protein